MKNIAVTPGAISRINESISGINSALKDFKAEYITSGQASADGFLYGRAYLVILCASQATGAPCSAYLFFPGYTTSKLTTIIESTNKATVDSSVKNKLNFTWGTTGIGGVYYRLA